MPSFDGCCHRRTKKLNFLVETTPQYQPTRTLYMKTVKSKSSLTDKVETNKELNVVLFIY